jgi:hypothetical protein
MGKPEMTDEVAIPDGLGEAGSALHRAVTSQYELSGHESFLLHGACRVADRLQRLADESVDAPLTVTNFKGDEVANPLYTESRQQQIVFARLIASLRLPDDEAGVRPQRRGSARGTYAAGSTGPHPRWTTHSA